VKIVSSSRKKEDLELAVSPRGSIALMKLGQAWAYIHGRDYIIPDDIKDIAESVLAHRIILKAESRLRGRSTSSVIQGLLKGTEVPLE